MDVRNTEGGDQQDAGRQFNLALVSPVKPNYHLLGLLSVGNAFRLAASSNCYFELTTIVALPCLPTLPARSNAGPLVASATLPIGYLLLRELLTAYCTLWGSSTPGNATGPVDLFSLLEEVATTCHYYLLFKPFCRNA